MLGMFRIELKYTIYEKAVTDSVKLLPQKNYILAKFILKEPPLQLKQ